MSEVTRGIMGMPLHLAMSSELSRAQFHSCAQQVFAENMRLSEEIDLDNKIIAERDRLLAAIPECAAHGRCVPYAIQWVKDTQTQVAELLEARDQLSAETEVLRQACSDAIKFVAFAFDQGIEGAESVGRAIERALEKELRP